MATLFLVHRIPYPPDKGDKLRSWRLLNALAAHDRVHLGAFVDDPADMAHAEVLRPLVDHMALIPLEGRWRRALTGLRRRKPLTMALYNDPAMHAFVRETLRDGAVDRILLFSSQMGQYVFDIGRSRRIVMDFVDLDSDKFRQYADAARGPKRWLFNREADLLLGVERRIAGLADAATFVTDADATLFARRAGESASRVAVMGNGVDLGYFSPDVTLAPLDGHGGGPLITFTGAMDYAANVDGAQWFVRDLWPAIRARVPGVRFAIVGSNPVKALRALDGRDDIVVTGRVPDVRPWLRAASVAVAPLRIARGVQNKVLEAMAMARPTVATPAAARGIDAEAGRDLLVADSDAAFIDAVVGLLDDRERGDALGLAGRARVVDRYDWDRALASLPELMGYPDS